MYSRSGLVKLIDFGMSKALEEGRDMQITAVGTTEFMPPEMLNGQPYNEKADIWSLGVVIYQLMSIDIDNSMPFGDFRAASEAERVIRMIEAVKKKMKPLPDTYSFGLRNLVTKMLRKDFNERPGIIEILNMPILQKTLVGYLKSEKFKKEVAKILN